MPISSRPDFLRRTRALFRGSRKGSPWCRRAGPISIAIIRCSPKWKRILLDGHFVIEHGSRSRSGTFFNFNGTAGVWRRTAIDDAGGWQHDTLTEDTDLSYRAQLRGWQFVYLPRNRVPLGAARGDERLQSAASPLGQGPDADREKDSAAQCCAPTCPWP